MRHTLLILLLFPTLVLAQGKKKPAKDTPKILVALPFGIAPARTTKLTLRGLKFDNATDVRVSPKGSVKLLNKSKVAVPNQQDPNRVGDSQIQVELNVPADAPGHQVDVVVVTPAGTSTPHKILLDRTPPVAEKEPNDGFKQAQPIVIGQTVQADISRPQDVDVFRFDGKAGQKVIVEVSAARLGSALDSFLTLYRGGQVLAMSDDIQNSTDSRIEITLPQTATYHLSISDAHDQGGPVHAYRLIVRAP